MFVVFGGIDIYNIVFLCQSKNIMFVFLGCDKKTNWKTYWKRLPFGTVCVQN